MPFFFEFMTLLALRIFSQQGIDVAILEASASTLGGLTCAAFDSLCSFGLGMRD